MKIRFFLMYSLVFTSLFFFTTQVESYAATEQVYEVGTSNLNVRTNPSHDAPVIGHLQAGERVTAFKEEHGWVQTYYHGEVVWIASQYLHPIETMQVQVNNPSQEIKEVRVTASGVNIRSGPGTNYSVVGSATSGDTYHFIESSGDWIKISLSNGSGWIAANLTDQATADNQVQEIVSQSTTGSLAGYNIVLDPGHGGKDPGSIGFNDVYEKDLINPTTEKIAQHLRDAGATVILTRKGDSYISLDDRIRLSNSYHADAFVSIHYNALPVPIVRGTSTYYYAGGRDRDLAQSIQTTLTQMNSVYDRGIRQGDFKVLRENKDLAVLIELGFITNPGELENVQSPAFQDEAAKAITNGLINYFNN